MADRAVVAAAEITTLRQKLAAAEGPIWSELSILAVSRWDVKQPRDPGG
jgi:hypothetical protein